MILKKDTPQDIMDKHFTLTCPHCNRATGITMISPPYYPSLARFKLQKVGIVYKCDACNEPIFLKFRIVNYSDLGNHRIHIDEKFETIENPQESFDFEYLPDAVQKDFKETLQCYSIKAYSAFAAMCRRTIQSVAIEFGSKGKDKVKEQIKEMKELVDIDDETYDILKQVIIDGHDGAHPHLPILSPERASTLLELMKDVMYQLFVRKGKVNKSAELRKQQIETSK